MWFNSLNEAQSYCDEYRHAPDRTVGVPSEVKVTDGTIKYYVSIKFWNLD